MAKQFDNEAAIVRKCMDLIHLMNIHLNHFPRHEKYGIQQSIRQCAYDVYELIIECQKRYHNKTSLTKLDVRHEQFRMLINLSYDLGYYDFHDGKRNRSATEANRRYISISILINELGAMIGGWIRSLNETRVIA